MTENFSKELIDWLESGPATEEILAELRQADIPDLTQNPAFTADLLKGSVTEDILRAMEEEGLSRNQLAQRLGKSRQYVGRVLNENANFTMERIAEFACALNRQVAIRMHRSSETYAVRALDDDDVSGQSYHRCEHKTTMSAPAVPPASQYDDASDWSTQISRLLAASPAKETPDEDFQSAA